MTMPIVRKGMIVRPNYGRTTEKYQKRFSKKDFVKLEKKLAKFQTKLTKMLAKGEPKLFKKRYQKKVVKLQNKVQALQSLLGMQPFDQSLQEQAMYEAELTQPSQSEINPLLIGVGGLLLIGGIALMVMKNK
jgi:hypothetical protein